jgi:hypothetical protein
MIRELLERAAIEKRLELDAISVGAAIESQDAGLRHRKGAIAYRLYKEKQNGAWVPNKRKEPNKSEISKFERKKQDCRTDLRELSHSNFKQALIKESLARYLSFMDGPYKNYRLKYCDSPRLRLIVGVKVIIRKILPSRLVHIIKWLVRR